MPGPITVGFIPGPRLIDGTDLNTLVQQMNSAVLSSAPTTLNVSGLPIADPHVAGDVWLDSGVLTVSTG